MPRGLLEPRHHSAPSSTEPLRPCGAFLARPRRRPPRRHPVAAAHRRRPRVLSTQVAYLGHDAGHKQVARSSRVSCLMDGSSQSFQLRRGGSPTQRRTLTDRAPCPHSESSTRMKHLLSAFRNCSSKVLRCPEDLLSVARHTPNSTLTSQPSILHRSRGSNRVVAHSGHTDDPFPARHSGDRIS